MARTTLLKRTANTERYLTTIPRWNELDVYAAPRWVLDPSDRQYKTHVTTAAAELTVKSAEVKVRGQSANSTFSVADGRITQQVSVELFIAAVWTPIPLTLTSYLTEATTATTGTWRWTFK